MGAVCMALSASAGGRPLDAVVLGGAWVPMSAGAIWACRDVPMRAMFRRVTVVQVSAGVGFGLYTLLRLVTG